MLKRHSTLILAIFILAFFNRGVSQIDPNDNNTPKVSWQNFMNPPDGATLKDLQKDFNTHWESRSYQKGKGYKPFKRWERYVTPRVYPSGDLTLPSNNYHNYQEWLQNQSAQSRSASANWTELGPFAKPTGADTGVGRLNMVRFDPTNNNIMYVGAPDGGLWKSTNGGSSWTIMSDFLAVIGASDLAIDPGNTNIMYLATGDIEGDRRSIGVLKSTDGGVNWSTTGLSWTATDNYRISKLLMDPTNSSVLLASTDGGVFKTTDGGANWTSPSTIVDFKDMEFKPGDPNIVYAVGDEFWKSTDKGDTWSQITSGLPTSNVVRMAVAVTPADADYVYVLAGRADNSGFLGLYRSTDSGSTFSTRSTSPNVLGFETDGSDSGGQAFYDLALAVAPDAADFVTVGGINMWQSNDGGTNWYIISHWNPDPSYQFVHADIHEINYMPSGSTTTFFSCNDGGISKTTDDGVTWVDISNNLRISQQNTIGISSLTSSKMAAGLQDIGSIFTDGSWSVVGGGDGEDCFIDRTNDDNIVISGTNGYHLLSTNGGTSFSEISASLPSGEFFSPIRQDPTVASRFYAAGRPNLYVSNNMGSSWASTGAQPFSGDPIIEFAVAPSDNTIIYALKGTEIAKSTNSGSTWTDITGTLPTGSASLTNLTISDTDADKVWVTFSGYSSGNKVYRTSDGGSTWSNLSTGLPNLPANTIVYQNGTATDDLYLGMDIGVYHIDNSTSTWSSFSTNLPNVSVRDLRIYYQGAGKLRAATYGRGAWETDLSSTLPVELISFAGERKDQRNHLNWTTATEADLDVYVVQRSKDGERFEQIGKVNPESANSNEVNTYNFIDVNPENGLNYYRLKIMDIDGQYAYSKIIVLNSGDKQDDITLYPNPATNTLELRGFADREITAHIFDNLGRPIEAHNVTQDAAVLDISRLPNGLYYLKISEAGQLMTVKRFVKN